MTRGQKMKIKPKTNAEILNFVLAMTRVTEAGALGLLSAFSPDDWKPLGGFHNNIGVVGNQSSAPDFAIVEPVTNAIDSLLMARALSLGIDPTGPGAPQSPEEAAEKFFGVPNGKTTDLDSAKATALSANVGIVATEGSSNATPNICVFDLGMGQPASKFEDTFLALNGDNKTKIPFTLGSYCMGSTSALAHSGTRGMKLLISKADPNAHPTAKDRDLYAVTAIVRQPPTGNMKSSQYVFLKPEGQILTFEADELLVLPSRGSFPDSYTRSLDQGTYILHYDYKLGPSLSTNIQFDFYNRINELLIGAVLPFAMHERRPIYAGHSFDTTARGLRSRIANSKDVMEPGFPAHATLKLGSTTVPCSVMAFQKAEGATPKKRKYAKGKVQLNYKGQAHAELSGSFFSRNSVGLSYIEDSLFVEADVSGLTAIEREEILMPNRERLREGLLKAEFEKNLAQLLKHHPGLRSLQNQRRKEMISSKLGSNSPLSNVLAKVLRGSKTLATILSPGSKLPNPFATGLTSNTPTFAGQLFPTHHTPKRGYSKNGSRPAELGRSMRVTCETDAENDYFARTVDPGCMRVAIKGYQSSDFQVTDTLWNGTHDILVTPPSAAKIGDELEISIEVDDPSRLQPFVHLIKVKLIAKKKHKKTQTQRTKKQLSNGQAGSKSKGAGQLALPNVIPVSSDQWDQHGFDANSALAIQRNGDQIDFYYNRDNKFLKTEQKLTKNSVEVLESQFSAGLALVGLGVLNDKRIPEEEQVSHITTASRSIAPMLLPMINQLGSIDLGS
jgi:hypothetical protein